MDTVYRPPTQSAVRVFRWLFLLGILYQSTLLFRSDEAFLARPYIEDAFYTLSVSRSIARGAGISVDGIHPTNGFQPLIALLNASCFALSGGNDFMALRLTLALQVVVYGLAALALGWLVTTFLRDRAYRPEVFWGTSVLALWNYSLSLQMLNGLETGLTVAIVCSAAAYYNARIAHDERPPLGRFAVLGLLLGAGVLSRIDTALFVSALLLWHLFRRRPATSSMARTAIESVTLGGVALAVSSPWWIYNYIVFDSLMPVSGQALRIPLTTTTLNVVTAIHTLSNALLLIVHVTMPIFGYEITAYSGLILFAMFGTGVVLMRRRTIVFRSLHKWKELWNWSNAMPLLMFSTALAIFYIFYFHAPHFLNRYLVVPRLLAQIGIVSFLYAVLKSRPNPRPYLSIALTALWVVTSGVLFVRNFTVPIEEGNPMMTPAHWIERHTTCADTIGMFQSGTTEFLFGNVVNLDGKVNSGALRALQQGRITSYIDSIAFDYIIDWPMYVEKFDMGDYIHTHYVMVDSLDNRFVVWRRIERTHGTAP